MTGTAATMGIEENLALAKRRGKARLLRPGITKAEREEYKELLKILGSWSGRPTYFQSRPSFRWSETGSYPSHGNPSEAKASAAG